MTPPLKSKPVSTACSPRVYPRPTYPSTTKWMGMLLNHVSLIPLTTCALLLWVVWPLYTQALVLYQSHQHQYASFLLQDDDRLFSPGAAPLVVGGRMVVTDDRLLFTGILVVGRIITAVSVHAVFFLCEYTDSLSHCKLNRKPRQLPSLELVFRSIRNQIVGTSLIQPLGMYWILHPIMRLFGAPSCTDPLPFMTTDEQYRYQWTWQTVLYCYSVLLMSHVLSEVVFYAAHRALHHPALYARFHKQHHEYVGTVSVASEHAHVVESLLGNLFPVLMGPVLFGFHPAMLVAYLSHKLKRSYEHHCGYSFRNTLLERLYLVDPESAAFHDFHHTANQGNFASSYVDWIFGTMDHWLAAGGMEQYVQQVPGQHASYLRQEGGFHKKQLPARVDVPVEQKSQ